MAFKSIFKLLVISILIITILNCTYANAWPFIGENQGKKIAQNYLNSHDLSYKVTTVTESIHIKNKKTGEAKWVTLQQWHNMTLTWYNTIGKQYGEYNLDHFEWTTYDQTYGNDIAWKITVVNSQGNNVGNIWINEMTGKIDKVNLQPNNQKTNTQNNNKSNQTINSTNQTNPESNQSKSAGNNTGIIFSIIILSIAIGAGYWKFNER